MIGKEDNLRRQLISNISYLGLIGRVGLPRVMIVQRPDAKIGKLAQPIVIQVTV